GALLHREPPVREPQPGGRLLMLLCLGIELHGERAHVAEVPEGARPAALILRRVDAALSAVEHCLLLCCLVVESADGADADQPLGLRLVLADAVPRSIDAPAMLMGADRELLDRHAGLVLTCSALHVTILVSHASGM